jgi:thiamine monophosphate kinase
MTKVSEISEFDLISRLETVLENNVTPNPDSKIELSIGEDAAVIGNLDNLQVVTTDAMVDKVHFVIDEVDMLYHCNSQPVTSSPDLAYRLHQ